VTLGANDPAVQARMATLGVTFTVKPLGTLAYQILFAGASDFVDKVSFVHSVRVEEATCPPN